MFVVQTGRAKRTRKYSILMIFVLLMIGLFREIFTMHWEVLPKKKRAAGAEDVELPTSSAPVSFGVSSSG
jgi:hypothetical protein